MKKILVIGGECESLFRFRGDLLKSFQDNKCQVYACTGGKCSQTIDWLSKSGIEFTPLPLNRTGINPIFDLILFYHLIKIIRRVDPDIVLAYTIKPVIYGMLASRICSIKNRYALITGLGYAFIPSRSIKQKIVSRIVCALYKISLIGVRSVFFQNKDDLNLFRRKKIISKSVSLVRIEGSGVDLDYYKFSVPPHKNTHFLLIARLLKDKGIFEYVEAAEIVRRRHPEKLITFSLLGPFDKNPSAITPEKVSYWSDNGLIQYLGETDDVRPYIEKCSVFVLPSYREGMPRSVLEAMSMGRAIITTDAPGCRDTVIPGKNGYLVSIKSPKELSDAMMKLIDNNHIQDMGSYSRKLAVERFDVHKVNLVMLEEMGIKKMPKV